MNLCEDGIKLFERRAKGPGKGVRREVQRGRLGSEDPEIELAVEEGDTLAIGRQAVPMRVRLPVNERAEPEAPKVVRHLRGGIGTAEQGGDARPQVAMPKAGGQMRKPGQGLEKGLHARIAEAKRGHAMGPERQRALQLVQRVGRERAVMTDALHREEGPIHVIAQRT